jgi:hypothetical protein
MARLDINKPYEIFLKNQVASGMFRSITAAAEDAIRKQMIETEKLRIQSVLAEVYKGELDVTAGKTKFFSNELLDSLAEKAKLNVASKIS